MCLCVCVCDKASIYITHDAVNLLYDADEKENAEAKILKPCTTNGSVLMILTNQVLNL